MIQIPKSAQEVFDIVVAHARAQGSKCVGPHYFAHINRTEEVCKYRHGNKKCFAGCLIPDNKYNPLFEGKRWFQLVAQMCISDDNINLITELQAIHDSVSPEGWEKEFKRVAIKEGLTYNLS